ncbi:MAG: hypothetical protein RBR67_09620 [Desulfobacterium sp.]|nr:hypothetical protein [Desulfobacterium sp.]
MMKFLVDTDILVSLGTGGEENLEIHAYSAVCFQRIVRKNRGALFVHPQSFEEVDLRFEGERAVQIKEQMAAYDLVDAPMPLSVFQQNRVGVPKKGSSDYLENALLAAVKAEAVDFLVTERISLHTRANRLGLSTRVLFLSDALGLVTDLFETSSQVKPRVEKIPFSSIEERDPVLWTMAVHGFNREYGQGREKELEQGHKQKDDLFNTTLARLRAKGGDALVIRDGDKSLIAGICVVEEEERGILIRLFHVISPYPVSQYGGLLFKAIFDRYAPDGCGKISFSKFPGRRKIMALAQSLGCEGENPMAFPKIAFKENNTWVLPLAPLAHGILFPELDQQLPLFPCFGPRGNAIEKVCLFPGETTGILPGDNLLIYRTKGPSAITAMGVVKETLVCSSPHGMVRFLGPGTAWNYGEIVVFCREKTLTIKFHHVKNFNPPLALTVLKEHGVLKGAPRRIVGVKGSGVEWLKEKLNGKTSEDVFTSPE